MLRKHRTIFYWSLFDIGWCFHMELAWMRGKKSSEKPTRVGRKFAYITLLLSLQSRFYRLFYWNCVCLKCPYLQVKELIIRILTQDVNLHTVNAFITQPLWPKCTVCVYLQPGVHILEIPHWGGGEGEKISAATVLSGGENMKKQKIERRKRREKRGRNKENWWKIRPKTNKFIKICEQKKWRAEGWITICWSVTRVGKNIISRGGKRNMIIRTKYRSLPTTVIIYIL